MQPAVPDGMEAGLKRLQPPPRAVSCECASPMTPGALAGTVLAHAGAFDVRRDPDPEPTGKARLVDHMEPQRAVGDWGRSPRGCYLLRTNLDRRRPRAAVDW